MERRAFLGALAGMAQGAGRPPNIVLILADDLGWTGIRAYGGRHARTPNIDRMASEGVRFTQAYVTPQCTPTRASLLTGQHTARNRMWHVIPKYGYPWARVAEPEFRPQLPRGTATVAAQLRRAGYATACIGKWHLTTGADGNYEQLFPEAADHYGFDYAPPRNHPPGTQARGDKAVDQLTAEAIGFMRRNRERPYFLYLAHHTIHSPVIAPQALVDKYRKLGYRNEGIHNTSYLAALEHLDNAAGRVLAETDQNTIVIFLSDNGGVDTLFDNAPLRAGKGSPYEGGIRVPAIVRWPGVVKPGTVSDVPVHVVDWYPTLLEVAGGKAPDGHTADGVSLAPLLRSGQRPKRDNLYWYMPLYDVQWGATPCAAIRSGNYKLIEFFGDYVDVERDYECTPEGRIELYDLGKDPGERTNLAGPQASRGRAMQRALREWIESCGAVAPGLNPRYDPARWRETARG